MLALVLAAFAWAACETPVPVTDLRRELKDAEAAFAALDSGRFRGSVAAADAALPCVNAPLTAVDAAAFHRVQALARFFDDDEIGATVAFTSVLAIQPGYDLSEQIAPPGSPLRAAFEEAKTYADPPTEALPAPPGGYLQLDGVPGVTVAVGRPYVAQWIDADGDLRWTAYVPAGGSLPPYGMALPGPIAEPPDPVPSPVPDLSDPEAAEAWKRYRAAKTGQIMGVGAMVVGLAGLGIGVALATDDPEEAVAPMVAGGAVLIAGGVVFGLSTRARRRNKPTP